MKIRTYSQMEFKVIRSTLMPGRVVKTALNNCMKKEICSDEFNLSGKTAKYLLDAEHLSPLEHVSMTIFVEGISRSLLAQITRHRAFKFTSSSQHYQDYRDYEMVIPDHIANKPGFKMSSFYISLTDSLNNYIYIIDNLETPKEEARQVLPNACAVNLMITADARNMINFFRQRRCERNVEEMVTFADKWWKLAVDWFPEVFKSVGAPCFMEGKCNQGRMSVCHGD